MLKQVTVKDRTNFLNVTSNQIILGNVRQWSYKIDFIIAILAVDWYFQSVHWPRQYVPKTEPNVPRREKTCLRGLANNKGADQTAHPRSLISAFVLRSLESIISKLARWYVNFLATLCRWGDWFESHFVGKPEDRFFFHRGPNKGVQPQPEGNIKAVNPL